MASVLVWSTSTPMPAAPEWDEDRTYGMCLSCGAVEVALDNSTGTRDLSHMGESSAYPTGHGCEVCT